MAWFVSLLVGLAINIIAYLIMPKPKQPKPPAAKDMDNPTAEAGRPIPNVFGTYTMKGLNYLWYGDKKLKERKVKDGGGGKK
jgi:hypothetical protein